MKESRDRLSGLSDDLLVTVLYFFPLKFAITTAVLCKRWRWLWTQLPDIELSLNTDFSNHKDEFYTIVDNLLPKFTSPIIRRFSLNLGFSNDHNLFVDPDRKLSQLCSWFDWACHRKDGLQELNFRITGGSYPNVFPYTPLRVFQSPSLVILELRPWLCLHQGYGARNNDNNNNVFFDLPNLKKVKVGLYPWNSEVLEKLVSSSPSLDDLFIEDPYVVRQPARSYLDCNNLNLSSLSLRRLHMLFNHPIKVVLNTINLEYLGIDVYTSNESLPNHVSFVDNPPLALRAFSIIIFSFKFDKVFLPSNLFSVVSNVTSLTIMRADPLLAATTFRQLTHLKFMVPSAFSGAFTGLEFLEQCPALEVLTFDFTYCRNLVDQHWLIPDLTPQCLVTRVKRIEIIECAFVNGLEILLCLLNYLLGSSKALELLQINMVAPPSSSYNIYGGNYSELRLIKEVFNVPRSSPFCQIEFDGLHHRVFRKLDQGLSYPLQTYN